MSETAIRRDAAEVKEAISRIFRDTSVSRAVTKKYLSDIEEHLDGLLDTLSDVEDE